MKKIWLITDTHFGHANLIKYGRPADYEQQIWKGLEKVGQGDILIHLGDVAFKERGTHHSNFNTRLSRATRILLRGNHDNDSPGWYLNHGWSLVGEFFMLKHEGKNILFSHEPQDRSKINFWDINIHGHFHDNDHRSKDYPFLTNAHKLLAIEYTNYEPVLLDEFVKIPVDTSSKTK